MVSAYPPNERFMCVLYEALIIPRLSINYIKNAGDFNGQKLYIAIAMLQSHTYIESARKNMHPRYRQFLVQSS